MLDQNGFTNILKWDYSDIQDPIYKSEVQANQVVAFALIMCAVATVLVWAMVLMDFLWYDKGGFSAIAIVCITLLIIPALICFQYKGRRGWIKYMQLMAIMGVICMLYTILCVDILMLIPLPMLMSIRYFSRRLTAYVVLVTYILFFVAIVANVLLNVYINVTVLDLAGMTITVHDSLFDAIQAAAMQKYGAGYTTAVLDLVLINDYVPNAIILLLFSVISLSTAALGKRLIEEGIEVTKSTTRLESELKTASEIQQGMLPHISSEKHEYNICCSMTPAKEIGGDLYDYFMIDENRLAIIVADVSGKGIPAALFMALTKTLIKDNIRDREPSDALSKVNQMLCGNNSGNLFVTAWIGVVDMREGMLTYVNAGHNPPLVKHGSGGYEYLVSDPDIVLAAMDDYQYVQHRTDFAPGDRIFLYTDGVTEARNASGDMYGEDRLGAFLNSRQFTDSKDLISALKNNLSGFVGTTEQFDDTTMLSMYFEHGTQGHNDRIFTATTSELPCVLEYILEEIKDAPCTEVDVNMIKVCAEEVFVNIANYAYDDRGGSVKIAAEYSGNTLAIRFTDSGVHFNPLEREDPDIDLPAEERDVGGLGVYLVKTYFDSMEYEYLNNQNVLTLYKTWGPVE